jgi:hypothetical protein
MPVLPSRTQDLLDWMDQHRPVWIANAAGIGLTPAQANAFNSLAQAARAAWNDRLAEEEEARVAVNTARVAIGDARRSAGDLIRTIKAFAENSSKPDTIYDLAQIPPPQPPAPLPAPGRPFDITVGLEPATGAITLRWKCTNPPGAAGTSYIVRRRTSSTAEFAFVGVTGIKTYVDSTFTAGPDSVQYTIQGQRSDSAGPVSDILTINFGRGGPGVTIIGTSTQSARLAA